jgi:hypothetical protein
VSFTRDSAHGEGRSTGVTQADSRHRNDSMHQRREPISGSSGGGGRGHAERGRKQPRVRERQPERLQGRRSADPASVATDAAGTAEGARILVGASVPLVDSMARRGKKPSPKVGARQFLFRGTAWIERQQADAISVWDGGQPIADPYHTTRQRHSYLSPERRRETPGHAM